jgi:hypothetical protein
MRSALLIWLLLKCPSFNLVPANMVCNKYMFPKFCLLLFNNYMGGPPLDSWVPKVDRMYKSRFGLWLPNPKHAHNFCISLSSHLSRGQLCKI